MPPLHQRPISWDPPPFPPIACWEPLGGSSLSWISSLPSLPFRKLNRKKLLPIWGKLIQGSQGDPPLPSRAGQFKLKISVCLRKLQPRGLYDYTYIADGETEDGRVSLAPQRQVAQERRRLQISQGCHPSGLHFLVSLWVHLPSFSLVQWGSDPVNALRFGTSEMSFFCPLAWMSVYLGSDF